MIVQPDSLPSSFQIRALRADDLDALQRGFQRLTPDEVQLRFFNNTRELPAPILERVRNLDPAQTAGFVIDDGGEIRAVADLEIDPEDPGCAEFGLIVGKAVSGRGLGRHLMRRLLAEARERSLHTVHGYVFADNMRMLSLCRHLGAEVKRVPEDPGISEVTFRL